jgi:NAD(P)-dependent dehydrogenase (short-subunit alcohol dehydrogenase family)
MKTLLKDKVIVVTGGAGLLGAEFVKSIANSGAIAIIADVNKDTGLALKDTINSQQPSGIADYINIDINQKQSILDAITSLSNQYGKLDAVVNNAYPRNAQYGRDLMAVEYDDFCENINLNLGGYFLTSQQFATFFLQQGFGNIINVASIYGVVAPKFEIYDQTSMTMPVEYAVIKSGLIHLTKYFAQYFKGQQIRVNALSPGGILDQQATVFTHAYRQHCLNKGMLEKQDLVGSLLYLLSDLSQYVNGQNLIVDDGFTL